MGTPDGDLNGTGSLTVGAVLLFDPLDVEDGPSEQGSPPTGVELAGPQS